MRASWGVYFITYTAANTVRTVCKKLDVDEEIPKFVIVTVLNTAACVAKDAVFAKTFGSGPARSIPALTYALFYFRDMLTMLASFNVGRHSRRGSRGSPRQLHPSPVTHLQREPNSNRNPDPDPNPNPNPTRP